MTKPTHGWRQLNLTCEDWQAAEQMAITHLGPLLADAEDAGIVDAWWFVRKGDTWRVRLRSAPQTFIDQLTTALTEHAAVHRWAETIYEPETHAFGGTDAMDIAHDLFYADSHQLLHYLTHTCRNHRRELAVVLATRLLRAAGLDFYEQGDCWTQLAAHRTNQRAEPAASTVAAVQQLITATTDAPASPLHTTPVWVEAFEHAGSGLSDLAARGALTRGRRAVLTHHLLFLFNRHGVSGHDQYLLATAASQVIFGTRTDAPDTTTTTTTTTNGAASATTLNAVTTDHSNIEARAATLRDELTDHIASWGTFHTPQVEAAFRSVPRHLFLPDVDLEVAYGRKPVVTRRADDGTSTSSASSPKLVATMLEQLAAQPGERVLEIGTATGINAALIAKLVGPTGTVVTIELDDDLAAGAAKSLVTAGYPNVKVICGDGALGHPDESPYDRIIVTAEAWDIVPAWWDQLAVGGRLVVPLRLHGSGLTRAIAFGLREPDLMASSSSAVCGFVPMRGATEYTEHHVWLGDDVVLKLDAADNPDVNVLTHMLTHRTQHHWTGIRVRHDEPAEHLDLWLVTMTTSNFGRLSVGSQARTTGLANPALRWAGAAIYDGETLAYITTRDIDDNTLEIGIAAHGPDNTVAAHLIDLLHQWDQQRPSQPTITAHRVNAATRSSAASATIQRPHAMITIE